MEQVTAQQLFQFIGELTVECNVLRTENARLKQELTVKEDAKKKVKELTGVK